MVLLSLGSWDGDATFPEGRRVYHSGTPRLLSLHTPTLKNPRVTPWPTP